MDLLSRSANYPIYIQKYMKFDREYRAMCVDCEVIGVVERERTSGSFVRSKRKAVDAEIPDHLIPAGIIGLDVGVIDDEFYVIEENYAPNWRVFEEKTGINVAKEIIIRLQEVQ
jgi:glutathione synthase/RimK-type ligase-like ATP-grasp enzyme